MDKYEFINELQRNLTGKVSAQKLQEIARYYSDYIDSEIKKGKTEEEVLAKLGEPRLLAKSIAQAEGNDAAKGRMDNSYEYDDENQGADPFSQFFYNGVPVNKWKVRLTIFAVCLVLLILIVLVFKILGFALAIAVPVLIPLGIAYLVYLIFFRK